MDSQSIRTAEGGADRGFDGAKKITGRKRHLIVDTLGLVLLALVHSASDQDADAAKPMLLQAHRSFYRLKRVFVDGAYQRKRLPWWTWLKTLIRVEVVPRRAIGKFEVLPKRWIVDRTFAWLIRYRRLGRDYERRSASSEAFIYIAMTNLMSKRIS